MPGFSDGPIGNNDKEQNNTPANNNAAPEPISLPKNIDTLVKMRDELEDYLSTVERNVDNVSTWLTQNKKEILLQNYALYRAIVLNKDEDEALSVLKKMGDVTGFVLGVQDFEKMAKNHLGTDIIKEIKKIKTGLPEYLQEELPTIEFPDVDIKKLEQQEPVTPVQEETSGGGFWPFNGAAKKAEREKREAEKKARELRKRLQQVRNDLVSLQSDKHYYIDSFMDWVGESLAPEETVGEADNTYVMEHYQDPQYMIRQAQSDLKEVLEVYAEDMRSYAKDYARIAKMLDQKQVQAFCDEIFPMDQDNLHPEANYFKTLLLDDLKKYGDTFADIALNYFTKPEDVMTFLEHVTRYEIPLSVDSKNSPEDVFEIILDRFIQEDYKDASILTSVLANLQHDKDFNLNNIFFGNRNVFEHITSTYTGNDDYDTLKDVLKALVVTKNTDLFYIDRTVDFIQAINNGDTSQIQSHLYYLQKPSNNVPRDLFQSLMNICLDKNHYDTFLGTFETLANAQNDYKFLNTAIESSLEIGLLGELNGQNIDTDKINSLIENSILPNAQDFSANNIGTLIQYTLNNADRNNTSDYRDVLENQWLETIASHAKLSDVEKTKWIKSFLNHFDSQFVHANILSKAAEKSTSKGAKAFLTNLENTLITDNVRLSDSKILTNLDQIANIWYNDDTDTMHYTVGGISHVLMENVPSNDAVEILDVLQRKGNFAEEYNGLLQPQNIEKILTNNVHGTRMGWQVLIGNMNADANLVKSIHTDKNFLHAQHEDQTLSIRLDSIALIQRISADQWMIIDQYGQEEILDDNIKFDEKKFVALDKDVFINPDAVCILSLDSTDDRISFRIESQEFDNFLTQYADDSFFYNIKLPAGAKTKILDDARKKVQTEHFITSQNSPGEKLYFNMAKLGYMSLQDKKQIGFMCQSVGMRKNGGFISTEDKALATSIVSDFEKSGKTLQIGNTFLNPRLIENMYYNPETSKLYAIVGKDMLDFDIPKKDAFDILEKLSKTSGFAVSGMLDHKGKQHVSDVISLERATYMFYAHAQEKIYLSYETNKTYINIDPANARAFFDNLEQEKAPKVITGNTLNQTHVSVKHVNKHVNFADVKNIDCLNFLLRPKTSGPLVAFITTGQEMTGKKKSKTSKKKPQPKAKSTRNKTRYLGGPPELS